MKGLKRMSDWKLHTPEGVNDILPGECALKKEIENYEEDKIYGWCLADECDAGFDEFL